MWLIHADVPFVNLNIATVLSCFHDFYDIHTNLLFIDVINCWLPIFSNYTYVDNVLVISAIWLVVSQT